MAADMLIAPQHDTEFDPSNVQVGDSIGLDKMTMRPSWWLRIMNAYSPPAAGYRRIFYTCVGDPPTSHITNFT